MLIFKGIAHPKMKIIYFFLTLTEEIVKNVYVECLSFSSMLFGPYSQKHIPLYSAGERKPVFELHDSE